MWKMGVAPGIALPPPLRARVERLILQKATRSERALCFARAAFCAVVLVRFLVINGGGTTAAWVTIPGLAVAMAFSAALLRRKGPLPAWLLGLSGIVDASVCFTALLPNVLWPWPEYRGLLSTLDVTAIFLVVCVSGLRLSPRLALLSTIYNALGATVLLAVDATLNGPASGVAVKHVVLGVIWLLSASWIAVALARRGLELASESAVESLRGAFAHQNLRALLAGHHDARTLLSSVTLHADLLSRRLESLAPDAEAKALSAALHRDLAELHGFERSIKEHAWGAVVSQGEVSAADPRAAFAGATRIVHSVFPDVQVTLVCEPPSLRVLVAGGTEALERTLLNLVINACEGDGTRGAARVRVRAQAVDGLEMVRVCVEDDGPGFTRHRLESPLDRPATTKEAGSGLGLLMVRNFAEASGGMVTLRNGDGGGARVELALPPPVPGTPAALPQPPP